jgi:hypothetical protein
MKIYKNYVKICFILEFIFGIEKEHARIFERLERRISRQSISEIDNTAMRNFDKQSCAGSKEVVE